MRALGSGGPLRRILIISVSPQSRQEWILKHAREEGGGKGCDGLLPEMEWNALTREILPLFQPDQSTSSKRKAKEEIFLTQPALA